MTLTCIDKTHHKTPQYNNLIRKYIGMRNFTNHYKTLNIVISKMMLISKKKYLILSATKKKNKLVIFKEEEYKK